MISDPLADMLIRIKNGYLSHLKAVVVPFSKIKEDLGKILVANGYLKDLKVKLKKEGQKLKVLELYLQYDGKIPALTAVKRISKPGLRIYTSAKNLSRFLKGLGMVVLSTPQGLMTTQEAKKKNLGGEVVCKIW